LLIKFICLSLIKINIYNMKTLIQKIILSKPFIILFIYTFVLCVLTFLLIGESLIQLIIFKLLN
jgi:hypothetical protein